MTKNLYNIQNTVFGVSLLFHKKIILFCILTFFIFFNSLFYQNCKQFEGSSKNDTLSADSGNGGHYEGKPGPGEYWNHIVNYGCLDRDVAAVIKIDEKSNLSLKRNSLLSCAQNSEAIDFSEITYFSDFKEIFEFEGKIYQKKQLYKKQFVPEMWCRSLKGNNKKHILVEINIGDSKVNAILKQSEFLSNPEITSRTLEEQSVTYVSNKFKLEVDLSTEILKGSKHYNGTYLNKDTNSSESLECISGSNTLPESRYYKFEEFTVLNDVFDGGPYKEYVEEQRYDQGIDRPPTLFESKSGNYIFVFKHIEFTHTFAAYETVTKMFDRQDKFILAAKLISLKESREIDVPILPREKDSFFLTEFAFDNENDRLLLLDRGYESVGNATENLNATYPDYNEVTKGLQDQNYAFRLRIIDLKSRKTTTHQFSFLDPLFSRPQIRIAEDSYFLILGQQRFTIGNKSLVVKKIDKSNISKVNEYLVVSNNRNHKIISFGKQVLMNEKNLKEQVPTEIYFYNKDFILLELFNTEDQARLITDLIFSPDGDKVLLKGLRPTGGILSNRFLPYLAKIDLVKGSRFVYDFASSIGETCHWPNSGGLLSYMSNSMSGYGLGGYFLSCSTVGVDSYVEYLLKIYFDNHNIVQSTSSEVQSDILFSASGEEDSYPASYLIRRGSVLDKQKVLQIVNSKSGKIDWDFNYSFLEPIKQTISPFKDSYFIMEKSIERTSNLNIFKIHRIYKEIDEWKLDLVSEKNCKGNSLSQILLGNDRSYFEGGHTELSVNQSKLLLDIAFDPETNREQVWLLDLISKKAAMIFENADMFEGRILSANFSRNQKYLYLKIGYIDKVTKVQRDQIIVLNLNRSFNLIATNNPNDNFNCFAF